MKTRHLIPVATVLFLAPASLALADTGVRQDNSDILVWAFLGMCALIVIIQLMPVFMLAFGLLKGLLKGKADTEAKEVAAHK
jgi:hypothetical protein